MVSFRAASPVIPRSEATRAPSAVCGVSLPTTAERDPWLIEGGIPRCARDASEGPRDDRLEAGHFVQRLPNVRWLRKDEVLDLGLVRDERVGRRDPFDRRV